MRFHTCAWLCRANDTLLINGGSPKGLPYPYQGDFLEDRRGGDDSPYQGEMARRARGDRELPLPPYLGNFPMLGGPVWDRPLRKYNNAVGAAISRPHPLPPGHRALSLQKLPLVRFRFRAWVSEPT